MSYRIAWMLAAWGSVGWASVKLAQPVDLNQAVYYLGVGIVAALLAIACKK
ncbi:MAG: hypothetical protein HY323_07080 [Betaproteobacteria bacterium]|nr:hypothetical protein [Betaproteobacteria bacterium]